MIRPLLERAESNFALDIMAKRSLTIKGPAAQCGGHNFNKLRSEVGARAKASKQRRNHMTRTKKVATHDY